MGLIESLLTLNIIDEITETRGNGNKEAVAQGAANICSGFFSGMGGCAMLGQSLINISSGARERISGIVASVMLLVFIRLVSKVNIILKATRNIRCGCYLFSGDLYFETSFRNRSIMFGADLVEQLPIAALTGLMIMVAIGTFEWASLKTFTRMPNSDILLMIIVTLLTAILHNLALAVIIGVILAALKFSWDNAKQVRAKQYIDDAGIKHYEFHGALFFASVTAFNEQFDVLHDPDEVIIDFANSRVVDMSAIEALNKITGRYLKVGKKIHLKHLCSDCLKLLKNAKELIDVNVLEDPTYKLAVDKI